MKTRETITLDARAQQRLMVLTHVLARELDPAIAAQALELSERQVQRLTERLRTQGAAGLVHGNRGRGPVNRTSELRRSRVVESASGSLAGFNPVHLSECLAEADEPIELSARTVRRILAEAGLRPPRTFGDAQLSGLINPPAGSSAPPMRGPSGFSIPSHK